MPQWFLLGGRMGKGGNRRSVWLHRRVAAEMQSGKSGTFSGACRFGLDDLMTDAESCPTNQRARTSEIGLHINDRPSKRGLRHRRGPFRWMSPGGSGFTMPQNILRCRKASGY
jgi:hypothetical protein